jgi:hypothetical protein
MRMSKITSLVVLTLLFSESGLGPERRNAQRRAYGERLIPWSPRRLTRLSPSWRSWPGRPQRTALPVARQSLHRRQQAGLAIGFEKVKSFPVSAMALVHGRADARAEHGPCKRDPGVSQASVLDPPIIYINSGRYDPDYDALYIPVVHDHRGANSCVGRHVTADKMHFVVYHVASGWDWATTTPSRSPTATSRISKLTASRATGV